MIEGRCILKYDPEALSGNRAKLFKPWWLIGFVDGDIVEYYSWFIKKRTGIVLQKPAWGAHISIVRGEEPINMALWKAYDNSELDIIYDPDVRSNGKHWWLRIECERMREIREELGLERRHEVGLHLTLGNPVPRCDVDSKYFHEVFTKQ